MDAKKYAARIESEDDTYFADFILQAQDSLTEFSEAKVELLRSSKGLRFILLASFHDASPVSINRDRIYGKDALELVVDFTGAEVNSFRKNYLKYKLQFIGIDADLTLSEHLSKYEHCDILYLDVTEAGDLFKLDLGLFVVKGSDSFEEKLSFTFSDVKVALLKKTK